MSSGNPNWPVTWQPPAGSMLTMHWNLWPTWHCKPRHWPVTGSAWIGPARKRLLPDSKFGAVPVAMATLSPSPPPEPDEVEYTDSGLSADTTYVYRILSLSGATRTGYSNEAYATTFSTADRNASDSGEGGGGGCFIAALDGRTDVQGELSDIGTVLVLVSLQLLLAAWRWGAK